MKTMTNDQMEKLKQIADMGNKLSNSGNAKSYPAGLFDMAKWAEALLSDLTEPKKYVPLKTPLFVGPHGNAVDISDGGLAVSEADNKYGWMALCLNHDEAQDAFKKLIFEHAMGRKAIELLLVQHCVDDIEEFRKEWEKGPQDDRD